jgi:membrane-bound metal-dependent hydrolase YbcI (DUF457 family)
MNNEVDYLAARQKLFAACEEYATTIHGRGVVATDIIVSMSAVNMHEPNSVTHYMREHRGPIHSVMGLIDLIKTDVQQENLEAYENGDH